MTKLIGKICITAFVLIALVQVASALDIVEQCKLVCNYKENYCKELMAKGGNNDDSSCVHEYLSCSQRCNLGSSQQEAPSSEDGPGQLSSIDATGCTHASHHSGAAGYIEWKLINSCHDRIYFEFDECD